MDNNTSYETQAIDINLLSVLDITKEGKVVSAEKWVELWNLVFQHINKIDAFCVDMQSTLDNWHESEIALNEIIEDIQMKYDALSTEFIHYGENTPENPHIMLWVRPMNDIVPYRFLTDEDIDILFNPKSNNAQSGKAVAEAVSTIFKQSKAQYGDELISADGWTLDGWTGDFASGFVHTVGKTGILTFSLGNTGTNIYCLEFDVTSPTAAGSPNASTAFTVTIGNSPRFITYDGGGSKHYRFGIKSVENGDLKFIPTDTSDPNTDGSTFDGTISNISLKQIISYNEPSTFLKDIDSNVNILEEKRFLYDSIYVGKNSGQLAIQGSQLNFAFGNDALRNNTTGYWNTAIGSTALRDNTVGSRNVAIGKMALEQNSSGDRNIGIGSFSLCRNINGRNNIGIGADSLWTNISGNGNIGIGLAALGENKTGSFNVCIGYNAMPKSTNGEQNIAIGYAAMNDATTGKGNIGIGYWALKKNQANYNIAIGSACLLKNTTGSVNIAIGQSALESNVVGNSNIAIGHNSGKMTTGSQSVFIGAACGQSVTGDQNTLIGYNVAKSLAGGTLNTIIGGKADAAAGVFNTVVIGYNASATKSNQVVIGNDNISETLLKGNLIVRSTDGTKRKILFNTDGSITWSEVA